MENELKEGIELLIKESNEEGHEEECSKKFVEEYLENEDNDLSDVNEKDLIAGIYALVEDEVEAISGYDKIILMYKSLGYKDDNPIIKDLEKIKKEEYEHIDILKNILKDKFDIEYGTTKED